MSAQGLAPGSVVELTWWPPVGDEGPWLPPGSASVLTWETGGERREYPVEVRSVSVADDGAVSAVLEVQPTAGTTG